MGAPYLYEKLRKMFFSIISNLLLYKTQKDGGPQGYPGPPVPSSLLITVILFECLMQLQYNNFRGNIQRKCKLL